VDWLAATCTSRCPAHRLGLWSGSSRCGQLGQLNPWAAPTCRDPDDNPARMPWPRNLFEDYWQGLDDLIRGKSVVFAPSLLPLDSTDKGGGCAHSCSCATILTTSWLTVFALFAGPSSCSPQLQRRPQPALHPAAAPSRRRHLTQLPVQQRRPCSASPLRRRSMAGALRRIQYIRQGAGPPRRLWPHSQRHARIMMSPTVLTTASTRKTRRCGGVLSLCCCHIRPIGSTCCLRHLALLTVRHPARLQPQQTKPLLDTNTVCRCRYDLVELFGGQFWLCCAGQ